MNMNRLADHCWENETVFLFSLFFIKNFILFYFCMGITRKRETRGRVRVKSIDKKLPNCVREKQDCFILSRVEEEKNIEFLS